MSEPIRAAADRLRDFLFDRVYEPLNRAARHDRAQHVVRDAVRLLRGRPRANPRRASRPSSGPTRPPAQVADFIASMTDRYAVEMFESLFVPRFWST